MTEDPIPQLKNFTLVKKLGSGTYAAVFKMVHKNTGEAYAVKCIKKSSLNKSSTENMLREIEILKNIKNEYIVQLLDFQWDEVYIYLIMEYCSGGDLSTFIKSRRTIPEKYVRRFVQQIACSLMHLHKIGIAHMDLKPQNILLTSVNNPSLKLADFGFAQYMKENIYSKSLRGSPLYMAPEILKNKIYDSKVDLWSVGVILHEVIFGYAPFVSNSFDELEKKILDDTPIQIPNHVLLSQTCKDLLHRLLQRNPADRISFAEFFNHPFVDLEHMPSASSLPKANFLLNNAIRADEDFDYVHAQKLYLQAIEYLIPAIKFETNLLRKQKIRERAKNYLKRSEEISAIIQPLKPEYPSLSQRQLTFSDANQSPTVKMTKPAYYEVSGYNSSQSFLVPVRSNSCSASVTSASNVDVNENWSGPSATYATYSSMDSQANDNSNAELYKIAKDNPKIQSTINSCFDLEEKIKSSTPDQYGSFYDQYEQIIAILLDFAKKKPKEDSSKLVIKKFIANLLSTAEYLKKKVKENESSEQLQLLQVKEDINKEENENENSTFVKQCILQ